MSDLTPGPEDPILEPNDPDDDEQEDRARRLVFATKLTPGRCASCGDTIPALGPVCCTACVEAGYCSVCGQAHRPTQCPLVTQARHDMERAEMLMHKRMVADWAAMLREAYEAMPVWTEAT